MPATATMEDTEIGTEIETGNVTSQGATATGKATETESGMAVVELGKSLMTTDVLDAAAAVVAVVVVVGLVGVKMTGGGSTEGRRISAVTVVVPEMKKEGEIVVEGEGSAMD